MSELNCYAEYNSGGDDSLRVCDGEHHWSISPADHMSYGFKAGGQVHAHQDDACDGSCKEHDLHSRISAWLEKLRKSELHDSKAGTVLPVRMQISSAAKKLIDSGEILGREVSSWYAKRGGEGSTHCLKDGLHLVVSINYDWWSGEDTGFYKTVKVALKACERYDHPDGNWIKVQQQTASAMLAERERLAAWEAEIASD